MSQKIVLWLVCAVFSLVSIWWYSFAQSNEETLKAILWDWSWWYTQSDKDKISFVSLNGSTLVLSAPLAQKNGKAITSYFITRGPIPYKDIAATNSVDDLNKIMDSRNYKSDNNKSVYEVKDNKLILTLPITDITADLYVTIAPEEDAVQGSFIEDYKINPASQAWSTTKVLAENFSNSTLNKAVVDVSCIWTKDQNRVNLTWSVNTALNATKVEIYHRGDENQWPMDLKGSPDIDDKSFTLNTPHRDIQLFRFKPVDNNGTMVGEGIQYICKPDVRSTTTIDNETDDANPIPVTPHTWPKETLAFILFISALAYAVYRKTRTA